MDNAMKMIGDIVSSLTKILVAVIGLGVVAGIVFGDTWFFGDVLSNLLGVVSSPVSYTHLTLPTRIRV